MDHHISIYIDIYLRQPQDQLQTLCAEEQDHLGRPRVELERQGGGLQQQVENPHQGAALHPLLQDVPALSNRESDDYAHWIYPEQAHRILLLLQTQRRLAFVIIIFAIFHFGTENVFLFCTLTMLVYLLLYSDE